MVDRGFLTLAQCRRGSHRSDWREIIKETTEAFAKERQIMADDLPDKVSFRTPSLYSEIRRSDSIMSSTSKRSALRDFSALRLHDGLWFRTDRHSKESEREPCKNVDAAILFRRRKAMFAIGPTQTKVTAVTAPRVDRPVRELPTGLAARFRLLEKSPAASRRAAFPMSSRGDCPLGYDLTSGLQVGHGRLQEALLRASQRDVERAAKWPRSSSTAGTVKPA